MKSVHNWINIIQDYLLPPTCILCGNTGENGLDLCKSCYQRLLRNNQCCYRCAEIFEIATISPVLCGRCLSSNPAFDETYAPFIYQGEMRHLITSLKFGAHYKNARLLGLLLAEHLKKTAEKPDLILPVPLHKTRYQQRGFNQAIEIAKTVAKELKIPLDLNSCIRHRDTPHQTALTAKQRRKNIQNSFSIIKPLHAQHIAILDDVMTTGSTAHELAYLLKKAGVDQVDVWVCARA
ncbi:ComF family protein [Methylobacter psychrophilus]|uniref:ComF family protein n=1 Tax=Methylobacter psychrophilus TaxID=96941 RepID=UPI0021D49D1B|nr:ComF family protein [Methylobacter psychrophilus]